MPVRIVVVRHGERLDEADRREWHRIRTQETRNDPPLTSEGWEQAKLAGRKIASLLQQGEVPVTVYSSPTVRTLATAAGIVQSLRDEPLAVSPIYALNCCAAAQSHGVARGFPKGKPHADILNGVPLAFWPPLGDADQVDRRQGGGGGFVESVKDLAAKHAEGDVLILVTHREGIWQLCRHVGGEMKSGYCNISDVSYEHSRHSLALWDRSGLLVNGETGPGSTPCRRRAPCPPRMQRFMNISRCHKEIEADAPGATTDDKADVLAAEAESLESVLKCGMGTVMIHRKGRTGHGTALWCTPGVRGKWVEGGVMADGEIVTLLGSPVCSEGDEGDFVLIRRSSGVEGWTKVRNVHLRHMGR